MKFLETETGAWTRQLITNIQEYMGLYVLPDLHFKMVKTLTLYTLLEQSASLYPNLSTN